MMVRRVCGRCGGTGEILRFSHVAKGVCFECKGSGEVLVEANSLPVDDLNCEPAEPNTSDVYESLEEDDNRQYMLGDYGFDPCEGCGKASCDVCRWR